MIYFMISLCLVAVGFLLFCFYMLYRNGKVAERRFAMNEWSFRHESWDEYEKHTYEEMMHKFWIPVNEFYKKQLGE